MARFCFYCGKELTGNEMCSCRLKRAATAAKEQTQAQASSPKAAPTDTYYTNTNSTEPKTYHTAQASQPYETYRSSHTSGSVPKKSGSFYQNWRNRWNTTANQRKQKPIFSGSRFLTALSFFQKFARPIDVLQNAGTYLKYQSAVVFMLIKSSIVALFFTVLLHQDSFQKMIPGLLGKPTISISNGFSTTLTIYGIAFITSTLLTLTFVSICYALIRFFLPPSRLLWRDCFAACRPAYLYTLIPLILILPSIRMNLIYAIIFLFLGLAIEFVFMILAIKIRLRLDSNTALYFGIIATILFCNLLAMLLRGSISIVLQQLVA